MSARASRLLRRFPLLALAAAALVAPGSRADLSWFDLGVSVDRPHVSFGDVIAWSDACLSVRLEEWPAVERVYSEYIRSWNGDGRDEDKLWAGLESVLGAERSSCIGAFRAASDAILRSRDSSSRHVAVRRELIGIAATQGQHAADAQRIVRQLATRIADSVTPRSPIEYDDVPPMREVADIRDAIVPLRGNLAAVFGDARADEILANIVQAYELSGTTALLPEFRAIIAYARRLTDDERKLLADAYAEADAKLRGKAAYESPRETRVAVDDELYRKIEEILGAERADLVRGLAGGSLDVRAYPELAGPKPNTPLPMVMNSAADAILTRFVDGADLPAVEAMVGRAFWRPLSSHPMFERERPEPRAMSAAFLAAVAGVVGDDEYAIVEAMQADHNQRWAIAEHSYNTVMAKGARLIAITDMSLAEDLRTLGELQAIFGKERISDGTLALARLARIEQTLPFHRIASTFDTQDRIPWPSGSVASAALGLRPAGIAPLPSSHRASLRAALEANAEALVEGRLQAWGAVCRANAAFDRVQEQFAGKSRVARERLVAIAGARLDGLAACADAARRSYNEIVNLITDLASTDRVFESQYIALAAIEQDLGRTEAGRRLEIELDRHPDAAARDRALVALVPTTPTGSEILLTAAEAALAAGNMDDGNLDRIRAGAAVLETHRFARQRLDRAMRAQVAIAWRTLRDAGNPVARDAFRP
ncbi:MAG: hypothetical protein RL136_1263 [Planctomycetota bacterium]|jgi:hypothetical protein